MALILIVDDERDLADLVDFNLREAGFETAIAATGDAALTMARLRRPELVLLDLMLPDVSGRELCRRLKGDPALASVPVVMLTARADESDRVQGFEAGADDYVTKPFSVKELVLRVKAVLKRAAAGAPPPSRLRAGQVVLELDAHRCLVAGVEVPLTVTEFRLVCCLMRNAGLVRTREQLLAEVWDITSPQETRTVDTTVMRLREKLGPERERIETVRGVGYRMAVAEPLP